MRSCIRKTPDVCGGSARVRDTSVPVWMLVRYRELGASEKQLLRWYPYLKSDDLQTAWKYYNAYREEIDQEIADQDSFVPVI
tara:strand:+ start:1522 stop:1767 length:246 start_codon:yes stop_codon:yes gene_type:complete